MRVSQEWAGKGWGGMQIPHVGHEVIVAFVEGDPDRPLIVGRVYNAEQSAPMPLPAEKTRSVLRDYGGNETVTEGAEGKQFIHTKQTCGNEFLIDGKAGGEKIELRDKFGNEIVLDAVKETIKVSSPKYKSSMVVGNTTKGGFEFKTEKDYKMDIGGDFKKIIGGKETKIVEGSKHETVEGYYSKIIQGLKHETVIGAAFTGNFGTKVEVAIAGLVKITAAAKIELNAMAWKYILSLSHEEEIIYGWKVKAGTEAKLEAPNVEINATTFLNINANTNITGNLEVNGNITYNGKISYNKGIFQCRQ